MKELFHLIQSLKPSEKRYFTLSANMMTPSKKNNYLKLFNAIESLEEYDETFLLKKFRNEPFVKNLAANKNHLYDILLESLRNYNEENIEEWMIKKSFYKIQLLASKGLDKACETLINKTKERGLAVRTVLCFA